MSLFDDWGQERPAAAQGRNPFADAPAVAHPPAAPAARRPMGLNELPQQQQQQQQQQRQLAREDGPRAASPTALSQVDSAVSLGALSALGEDALDDDLDHATDEEDLAPDFDLRELRLQRAAGQSAAHLGGMSALAVSNGAALLIADGQLWFWHSAAPDQAFLRSVQLPGAMASKSPVVFASVCPLGTHAVLSLQNGDNYYLHVKGVGSDASQLAAQGPIKRLKDQRITCVAWDPRNRSTDSTGNVLAGTATGAIWEISIEAAFFKNKKGIEKVYQLKDRIPLCGLEMIQLDGVVPRWFVMAATTKPTRFYQFIGGPTLEELFRGYVAGNVGFGEFPGDLDFSQLETHSSRADGLPTSFLLLSEAGLYVGDLVCDASLDDEDNVVSHHAMINFPSRTHRSGEELLGPPLSALETDYHYVLLYPSWIVAVHKLSRDKGIVLEQKIDPVVHGQAVGLVADQSDPAKRFVLTRHHVLRLSIRNEDGNVWRLYLDQARDGNHAMFDKALRMCKTESQQDKVKTLRADYYYANGQYELAAESFAETRRSFEEVALMFVEPKQRAALRRFLSIKLKSLPLAQKTQRTILAVWLVELWLEQVVDDPSPALVKEFHAFLKAYAPVLEPAKETIYRLVSSHGRDEDYLVFASLNKDYERVLERHIRRGDHAKAVETLAEQARRWSDRSRGALAKFVGLYYKFSSELMQHCPRDTVNAWVDASDLIEVSKLIPALVPFSNPGGGKGDIFLQGRTEAIRYLEHCIHVLQCEEEEVHNLLVALYAVHGDAESLLELLESPSLRADKKFALRVCTEFHQKLACVKLYSDMELYTEAVQLALEASAHELAQEVAQRPEEEALRRDLWLMIAKHEIEAVCQGQDEAGSCSASIEKALHVVQMSDELAIEDVLQFLPDFVAIGDLNEEICSSLEQYGHESQQLKEEMSVLTATADGIRQEIAQQDDNYMVVRQGYRCDFCGIPVLTRPFYVFPCTHAFHSNCLLNELSKHLSEAQREEIEALRSKLSGDDPSHLRPDLAIDAVQTAQQELVDDEWSEDSEDDEVLPAGMRGQGRLPDAQRQAIVELDKFAAAACPFCGDLMIRSVSEPFVPEDEAEEAQRWAV